MEYITVSTSAHNNNSIKQNKSVNIVNKNKVTLTTVVNVDTQVGSNVCDKDKDINIFRYKFTTEVMDALTSFAKIHQYDDRKTYKEAWTTWMEENSTLIRVEMERLTSLGYEGNIIEKMYKSSRYYFRTKTKKEQPVKRRKYISLDSDMLDAMDTHIHNNIKKDGFKPSTGYSDFCETNVEIIRDEVAKMCFGELSVDEIIQKFKKTYKNRYFIISRNTQHTD